MREGRQQSRLQRQSQRQGFLSNLAPQVLDKLDIGGGPKATLPSGTQMPVDDFQDQKQGQFDLMKAMPFLLAIVLLPKLMKK